MNWLGVDLGGTWLRAGLADAEALAGRSPEQVVSDLSASARSEGKTGVAISFAGWIDVDGGGISAGPNLGWGALPLVSMFEAEGLACHLENDLDARAWGEWLALDSEARALGDLMVINAGSGFALGLVIAGQLRRGYHRRAGEVGHWRSGVAGQCGCGEEGCVESLLGGANLQKTDLDDLDFRRRWIDLAVATLAPVIAALDPAHIIATGGILDHRPTLRLELQEALVQALPQVWWGELELAASDTGEALARLGVVDLAQRQQKG